MPGLVIVMLTSPALRSLHSHGEGTYKTNCSQTVFNLETVVGAKEENFSTIGEWDLGCRSK